MPQALVLVIAADLRRDRADVPVSVGPETAEVCDRAIVAAQKIDGVVCASAGYSSFFRCLMAQGPMRNYFIAQGVPPTHRLFLKAANFDTNGEVVAFAEHIHFSQGLYDRLVLVARWWHLPRVYFFLLVQRLRYRLPRLPLECIWVPSRDWRGMIREPVAWAKIPLDVLRHIVRLFR